MFKKFNSSTFGNCLLSDFYQIFGLFFNLVSTINFHKCIPLSRGENFNKKTTKTWQSSASNTMYLNTKQSYAMYLNKNRIVHKRSPSNTVYVKQQNIKTVLFLDNDFFLCSSIWFCKYSSKESSDKRITQFCNKN